MDTEKIDGRKDTTTAASEPDDLDRRIAELHAQGILIGGEGPRESLRPIAYIPGALKRLLERRDRS